MSGWQRRTREPRSVVLNKRSRSASGSAVIYSKTHSRCTSQRHGHRKKWTNHPVMVVVIEELEQVRAQFPPQS